MLGLVLAAALAAAAPPAGNAVPVPSAADAAGSSAAERWVVLVDQERWDESWRAAGALFRSRTPQAGWVAAIAPVRRPLGAVAARTIKGATTAGSLPGAPDGEYQLVQFATSFANKRDAIETVVLARELTGWTVAGYFIN
ncbi:MAG: DUF4019 domain-containing protein [Rhizorhabdus sp.]